MPRRDAEVVSLDVFDTAITRALAPPEAVFLALGRRLARRGAIPVTPEVFARARVGAERAVWHREGWLDSHVSLADIHGEVARNLALDPGAVDRLVDAELELEAALWRPTPFALGLVAEAVDASLRVVFTSDTYFPGGFLERELRRHGLWTDGSRCFASSDHAAAKASGRLYARIADELGVPAGRIVHVGDHPHSDVAAARGRGVEGRWFADGRLNRFERILGDDRWGSDGLAASLAGASRLARLHTPVDDAAARAIRDVAAGVAAPILVGYVLWILHRARALGLARVGFLARDGQVLADIARQLVGRLGWSIDIRYLAVSRLSTNLAATFAVDDEETGWVERDLEYLTAEEVLDRFDLEWGAIAVDLDRAGVRRGRAAGSVDAAGALEVVRSVPAVREQVLARAAARRALLGDYLRQEGLLDGGASGLVDFGGVGSQVRALHAVMVDAGAPAPRLFLVGVDRPEDAGLPAPPTEPAWLGDLECYLYDHRRGRGIRRARGFGTCLQMFCAADHRTVTGYGREADRIVAWGASEPDEAVVRWGLPVLRRTIRSVVDHLVLDDDLVDPQGDVRGVACAVVAEFWSRPTAEEAAAWGAFPLEGAQAASTPEPLAAAYSVGGVVRGLLDRSFPNLGWQHWYEASARLSPPTVRWPLATAARTYRALLDSRRPWARAVLRGARRAAGRSR